MLAFRATEIDRFPGKNYKFQSLCRVASRDLVMNAAAQKQSHVVILPYFCDAEIERYLTVARSLGQFGSQATRYEFLLTASPKIEVSHRLHDAFATIAPTTSFQCPTQIFGYPQGPTAMFWDCMDYIARHMNREPGFSLWLESDMAIVKPNWLDRLSQEWTSGSPTPLMMGCFVPDVYRWRVFKGRKHMLHAHINGGACYAKDFANHMPADARLGVFDMAIYPIVAQAGRAKTSTQICFSTIARARRDVLDPARVILHGFMQDKDQFIERCAAPVTDRERSTQKFNPLLNRFETARRQLRVFFVRRGPRAMFENMLLAQERRNRRVA